MKIIKLVSVGTVLLIAATVVASIMTGQLTFAHAAGLTAKQTPVLKQTAAKATPAAMPAGIPAQMTTLMPQNTTLLAHIYAAGVLAFACPATAQSAEVPMITLFADPARTQVIGSHYMDFTALTWEGLNGDKFNGAPLVKVVVNPNSAPWVLLQSVGNSGNGMFARGTFMERVFTVGGLPHPCNLPQTEEEVAFTTQYLLLGTPAAT